MNGATSVVFVLVLIGLSAMWVWAARTEEFRDAGEIRAAAGASLGRSRADPPAVLFGLAALLAAGYPSWVAGLAHRPLDVRRRAAAARPGTTLALVRDPFNEVDPRAVKLYLGDDWIGFVPVRHVGWVSERMDAGRPMLAEIDEVEVKAREPVRVWIRLRI